ncbi:hypothetical protein V1478_014452, partial [Vespula squamosa]
MFYLEIQTTIRQNETLMERLSQTVGSSNLVEKSAKGKAFHPPSFLVTDDDDDDDDEQLKKLDTLLVRLNTKRVFLARGTFLPKTSPRNKKTFVGEMARLSRAITRLVFVEFFSFQATSFLPRYFSRIPKFRDRMLLMHSNMSKERVPPGYFEAEEERGQDAIVKPANHEQEKEPRATRCVEKQVGEFRHANRFQIYPRILFQLKKKKKKKKKKKEERKRTS